MSTTTLTPHHRSDPAAGPAVRCDCGRLLGRIIGGVAHTRCQRCKRDVALRVTSSELRCLCRRLLARAAGGSVELKCPRCKRAVLVSAKGDSLD